MFYPSPPKTGSTTMSGYLRNIFKTTHVKMVKLKIGREQPYNRSRQHTVEEQVRNYSHATFWILPIHNTFNRDAW